jgi:uncharacterized protein (DUF2147 family)
MNLYVALSVLFLTSTPALAQKIKADDIIGIWVAGENKAKVQIYKSGNRYYGKITWLKNPMKDGKPKTDNKNPDPKLRHTPIVGLVVLKNFVFDDGEWLSGNIYDPSNGKEYSCKITMPDINTLKVRGYIGISLLGRTEVWKRG